MMMMMMMTVMMMMMVVVVMVMMMMTANALSPLFRAHCYFNPNKVSNFKCFSHCV